MAKLTACTSIAGPAQKLTEGVSDTWYICHQNKSLHQLCSPAGPDTTLPEGSSCSSTGMTASEFGNCQKSCG